MVSIPNPIQITNYGQVTMADHTQDLTLAWNPTTYSDADFVNVQLYSPFPAEWFNPPHFVVCRVPASAGTLTIPAAMLATFQAPATGSLSLSISRKPGTAAMFNVALSDGTSIPSVFQYRSAESIVVQFQ